MRAATTTALDEAFQHRSHFCRSGICFGRMHSGPGREGRFSADQRFRRESRHRQAAPAGDDYGFGEFWGDAKTARLISAGLLCNEAANLIHLPTYAIDHEHTMHQLDDAEFYRPTKSRLFFEIGDARCRKLGGLLAWTNEQVVSGGRPGRQKAQRHSAKSLKCPFARESPREPPGSRMGRLPGAIVTLFRLRDYDGDFTGPRR